MTEAQLKAFLEAVKTDTRLQEKLKTAADADAIAAIAKDAGFVISTANLKQTLLPIQTEISDEELEGVAGGLLGTYTWADSCGFGSCWMNW